MRGANKRGSALAPPPRNSASRKKRRQLSYSATMSSDCSVRARTREVRAAAEQAEGDADRAEVADADECALFDLMGVPDYYEVLCEQLDYVLLFALPREPRYEALDRPAAGGASGRVARTRTRQRGRRCSYSCARWRTAWCDWRGESTSSTRRAGARRISALGIAAGVTIVGQESVVLSGIARQEVETEGVCFDSMHLPHGVQILSGGSATMVKCTASPTPGGYGNMSSPIHVESDASLAMEDSRVFGCTLHCSAVCSAAAI